MKKNETFLIRLSSEEKKRIRELSECEYRSMSDFILFCVREYEKKKKESEHDA